MTPEPIRTVCCECGALIRDGATPEPVSHGLCPACVPVVRRRWGLAP